MATHAIAFLGDKVLRQKSAPVDAKEITSKKIRDIIKRMSLVLRATEEGIGIAAPQIGIPLQIFIASEEALAIDRRDADLEKPPKKKWRHFVFINPQVVKVSAKKTKGSEGCLSVPKKYGIVARAEKIKIRALDEHGKKIERGASGLFARLLQHEIDHLYGTLYIDKAEKIVDIA
ncbi:MAG: peptide deformylase [Candidatus Ryanbacteria bacterium]|nr:peptide deformylase [Candidatus Ryanbacteria bacterium]